MRENTDSVDCDKQEATGDATTGDASELDEGALASDNGDDGDDGEEDNFYCAACNKEFRTIKAFENHEASKKHRQNVLKLTKLLEADEGKLNK